MKHAVYVEDAYWNSSIDTKDTTLKDKIVALWQKLLKLKPDIFGCLGQSKTRQ